MRAITVRQPWADAIVYWGKRIENRGRVCNWRGPIAIHAGQTFDGDALDDWRILDAVVRDDTQRPRYARGAVIAIADLVDCHESTFTGRHLGSEPCCPPWGESTHNGKQPAYHLVLDNVRRLREPVPCAGKLMVPWTLPDDVAAQVEQQLAVARG